MEKLVKRKEYIEKLLSYKEKGVIKVVTGLRRSGKSVLLKLFKKQLLKLGTGQTQMPTCFLANLPLC